MVVKDPRLRLSAVIMTLQVLGQTVLGFKLSIAQVAASILTCVLLEAGITLLRGGGLRWPASAMLTGNGVALILRTSGTRHGDWWSLNGIEFFLLAATVAILSKYLVRPGGRHVYNPSNLALVLCFLVAGPAHVYPQYLWWGPMGAPVAAAWMVIVAGAAWVLWPLGMRRMVLAFTLPFVLLVAALASTGACFDATWRVDSVCGSNYWIGIATSPEVAIFVLFMMSDPRTSPRGARGRVYYGLATAIVAAALVSTQVTEYGIKVAILAALTIVCTAVGFAGWAGARRRAPLQQGAALEPKPVLFPGSALASIVIALYVGIAVLAMAGNQQLVRFERGGAATTGDAPKQ